LIARVKIIIDHYFSQYASMEKEITTDGGRTLYSMARVSIDTLIGYVPNIFD
jgi:hypothetical protein